MAATAAFARRRRAPRRSVSAVARHVRDGSRRDIRKSAGVAPSQSASDQRGQNGVVPFTTERIPIRTLASSRLLCSAVSQFPTRTPIRRTPWTRRIPAASSGLSRPESVASKPPVRRPPAGGCGRRCVQLLFQKDSVAQYHGAVEGQARLGAVPLDEVGDGSVKARPLWTARGREG